MKKLLAALALFVITIAGCHSKKQFVQTSNPNSTIISNIADVTWELTKLKGIDIEQTESLGEKIQFTLNSKDKTLSGYSGCNVFNSTYKIKAGGRIKIANLVSSRRVCPHYPVNESELLKVFELIDNYTTQNEILSMNVGKRETLATFKKVIAENLIVEKYWKLKRLGGIEVRMAEGQDREIFFTLKSNDNQVTGFAGCNPISGEYMLEKGNRVVFKNMAVTLKTCPNVADDESKILNIFNKADNYTIEGDILTLNIGRRAVLAVFEAVYMN